MTEFGDEARALLRVARQGDPLRSSTQARVKRATAVAIAVGTTTAVGAAGTATAAAAAAGAAGVAGVTSMTAVVGKLVLATALVAGAASAPFVLAPRAPERAPAQHVAAPPSRASVQVPTTIPAPAVVVPALPVEEVAPEPPALPIALAVAPPPVRRAPAPPPPSVVVETSTLRAEAGAMRSAVEALRDGRPAQALTLVEQHRIAFPDGTLAAEREVLCVRALCALGRTEEADTVAERSTERWPFLSRLIGGDPCTPR